MVAQLGGVESSCTLGTQAQEQARPEPEATIHGHKQASLYGDRQVMNEATNEVWEIVHDGVAGCIHVNMAPTGGGVSGVAYEGIVKVDTES